MDFTRRAFFVVAVMNGCMDGVHYTETESTDQKIFHECSWIIGMKYVGSPGVTLRDKMLHEESQRFVVMSE